MTKNYTAIGLMSGTSMDGVDASIIQSDGEDNLEIIDNHYVSYDNKIQEDTRNLKEKIHSLSDIKNNKKLLLVLEKEITIYQAKVVEAILKKAKLKKDEIHLIGFHGQTLYHSFEERISKQLGDGNLMKELTGIKVAFNFRKNDIENGGQGAPLSPIYHKLLCKKLKLEQSIAFVNIGGISNITFLENDKIKKSFDTGPGNFLVDKFLQIKSNKKINFDKDGEIAFKGQVIEIILENFLNNNFFDMEPPKTLDVNDFSISIIKGLNLEDSVATLSEFTSRTIVDSFQFVKNLPKKIILIGGGRKNKFFLNRINELSKIETISIDNLSIDGDFIESQAFAYLAIRSFLKKPISFFETTGVKTPCTGGEII